MYNHVGLHGRLVRDPELKYTASGKAVCSVRLAVQRWKRKGEARAQTDYLTVVCWGAQAESLGRLGFKGQLVLVGGRLQTRAWETNEGEKRWEVEVVASEVNYLEWRKGEVERDEREQQAPWAVSVGVADVADVDDVAGVDDPFAGQ